MRFKTTFQLGLLSVLTLIPQFAFAQSRVLEFPFRPVANSNRVIGLGGAFVGIAEGADGHTFNPASFASRYHYSRDELWDWDWALYWLNLPNNLHPDFANIQSDSSSAFHLGFGIDVKYSFFGAGLHAYSSQYSFRSERGDYRIAQTNGLWGFALTIPNIQLSLGATLNVGSNDVFRDEELLVRFEGSGSSFGALWFPPNFPFRLGTTFRLPQSDDEVEFGKEAIVFLDPPSVEQPAELTVGGSWMVWERKYNPRQTFGNVDTEGESQTHQRRYVLFAADLVTTFASPKESFSITTLVDNIERRSGENVNIALRLGVESELIENLLVLRSGYYQQPSRIVGVPTYHHFTAGADLRVPLGWDWKLNTVIDLSKDYFNFGLGIGLWH